MAETVSQLVDDVITEGGFDVDTPRALRWLNRRFKFMVGEARAYRKVVSVATTVAGQAFYAFSPVEAYTFEINGVPYGKARRADIYDNAQGTLIWEGAGGLIVGGADATGAKGITLIPTPTQAGLAITSFAAVVPADLTADAAGDTLLAAILDGEFADELVSGAIATGHLRVDGRPDLAAPHEQVFAGGVERLRMRTKRRYRGGGPAQIRIQGVNA